jgi:hypothetical protein
VEWEAGGRVEVGELDNRKLIHSHSRSRTSVFAFFLFPFFSSLQRVSRDAHQGPVCYGSIHSLRCGVILWFKVILFVFYYKALGL